MNDLYNKISILLIINKMKKIELAEKLNISTSVISQWKNEKRNPTIQQIIEISNIFNISTDYLLKSKTDEIDIKILNEYKKQSEEVQNVILKILDIKK